MPDVSVEDAVSKVGEQLPLKQNADETPSVGWYSLSMTGKPTHGMSGSGSGNVMSTTRFTPAPGSKVNGVVKGTWNSKGLGTEVVSVLDITRSPWKTTVASAPRLSAKVALSASMSTGVDERMMVAFV